MPLRYLDDHCWVQSPMQSLRFYGKLLYLYCLYNHHQKPHGIFQASPSLISIDTGIPRNNIVSLLQRFNDDGLVKWIVATDTIWAKEYVLSQIKHKKMFIAIMSALRQEPPELAQEYVAYYNDSGLWKKHNVDVSEFIPIVKVSNTKGTPKKKRG